MLACVCLCVCVCTFLHCWHALVELQPSEEGWWGLGSKQLGELKLREPLPLDASSITLLVLHILRRAHKHQTLPPQLLWPRPLLVELLLQGGCELRARECHMTCCAGGRGEGLYLLGDSAEIGQVTALHGAIGISQHTEQICSTEGGEGLKLKEQKKG